jgi:UDP-2,4-diacetamido-2,4,6-trideoxy-beta-L-altropyranose hydrolase
MDLSLILRPVGAQDMRLLFDWRNLDLIISLSSSQRAVTWEEHTAWFSGIVGSERCLLYIILLGETPIGQVRFDLDSDQRAIVSIYLLPGFHGKGFGTTALRNACEKLHADRPDAREILAQIRANNTRSILSFNKAGFKPKEDALTADDHVALSLPLSVPN